jgi:glutathione synthase/RimK-type ligase-like ATP-grasp enzyme
VILIVTNRGDHTADWLVLELERRGASFFRFNTEDYPGDMVLLWTPESSTQLGDRRLDEVKSVWYRRPVAADPAIWPDRDRASWALAEAREALLGVWRTTEAFWVNHPDNNRAASSKLEQIKRATALGFEVPRTLVTNDQESALDFLGSVGDSAICKPMKDGRLEFSGREGIFFTSVVDASALEKPESIGPEPYLFQELIKKRFDIRATVIGGEVFSVRIESQETEIGKVDWRRAGIDAGHAIEELPEDVAERCVQLTREYGLRFSAIDLVLQQDGRIVFLELNPNGQWAWVEQLTGLPLRSRMADLLEEAR